MKTVCVFCSSSEDVSEKIKQDGAQFGRLLAEQGCALLYGGTNQGLMRIVADAHKNAGGTLIGVIPTYMKDNGELYDKLDKIVEVDELGSRKQVMQKYSDVLVALPGGIGTYDEIFDAYSLKTVNHNDKPMFLLNSDSFFEPLIALINHGVANKTISKKNAKHLKVANTPEELIKAISCQ